MICVTKRTFSGEKDGENGHVLMFKERARVEAYFALMLMLVISLVV